MTQLHDPRFISFAGEPITGRTPTTLNVMNGVQMTPEQHGGVMHAYKLFRDCLATGIVPYLVQHWTLSDGTAIRMESLQGRDTVMVWPTGGLTVSEAWSMFMDSGVVDVGAVSETSAARFLPGHMIKSNGVTAYDSAFAKQSQKQPWWLNPSQGSSGQLSGEVQLNRGFTGQIRKDGVTRSFTPSISSDGVLNPSDEALVLKKKAISACPASIFTGRARLYAQAMYGAYLYDKPSSTSATDDFSLVAGGPPSLRLRLRKDGDTERAQAFASKVAQDKAAAEALGLQLVFKDPYDVRLSTNSGVHLDKTTGRHWLINPGYGTVSIYPLISSPAGEKFRKHLREDSKTTLSADDLDHLEAYVLSKCRPLVELSVVLDIAKIFPYSMGYGWHWNWSGTNADIVRNVAGNAGGQEPPGSTHYRLYVTLTPSQDGSPEPTFTANTAIIEGPILWMQSRWFCCITEPDWVNRQTLPDEPPIYYSEKSTQLPETPNPSVHDAPFYAFYKKDELQVCRSSAKHIEAVEPYVDFSPRYAFRLDPDNDLSVRIDQYTFGDKGGYLVSSTGVNEYYVMNLSCASESVNATTGWTRSDYRLETTKTDRSQDPEIGGFAFNGVDRVEYGEPTSQTGPYAGSNAIDVYDFIEAPGEHFLHGYSGYSMEVKSGTTVVESNAVAGAAVPYYDAEAIYLFEKSATDTSLVGRTTQQQSASFYEYSWWQPTPTSKIEGLVKTLWSRGGGSGATPTVNVPDQTTSETTSDRMQIVHRAGSSSSSPASAALLAMFYDARDPTVSSDYKTLTSSTFANPVIRGLTPGGVPIGMPNTAVINPAIVGWA